MLYYNAIYTINRYIGGISPLSHEAGTFINHFVTFKLFFDVTINNIFLIYTLLKCKCHFTKQTVWSLRYNPVLQNALASRQTINCNGA